MTIYAISDSLKLIIPHFSQNGEAKLARLLQEIKAEPKSLKWRMRAKVRDKRKWYRDVDELIR